MGFVFSKVSFLRFIFNFIFTHPRKDIYVVCILKKKGHILLYFVNSLLSNTVDQFCNYFSTEGPSLRINSDSGEGAEHLLLLMSYTFSDTKVSSETSFPFKNGLDVTLWPDFNYIKIFSVYHEKEVRRGRHTGGKCT